MAKMDMRWQRTERNLMAAFGEALAARPIDKISVTALAKAADINKATFYLHYRDVYDLAGAYARREADEVANGMDYLEAFFSDPAFFMRRFVDDFDLLRSRTDPLAANDLVPIFIDHLTARMDERLREAFSFEDDGRGEILLTFVIGGFFATMARYIDSDKQKAAEVGGHLLTAMKAYGPLPLDAR
ncbi:hypothetical protein B5F40_02760 [Gordonibacter sp. An230]|uniref:TetR/AcrR family transcriptional regulator n=1 Tax=Gordonibacter sp. An230 TaxID=1965592 RepID=UPI000B3964E2|nr:TetR/AcrR family transcriptional regulator [Gordonibacter sp. An230]OUO91773.1 hypothetical protein B5F40_02760 [Gordonibacter sp. An230]